MIVTITKHKKPIMVVLMVWWILINLKDINDIDINEY